MTAVGIGFIATSISFVIIQAFLVGWFTRILGSTSNSSSPKEENSVAILLCIRGDDPSLRQCIHSIAAQQYSKKNLFVVGDSESDPGLATVRSALAEHPDLDARVIVNPSIKTSCGLKCSNLIEGIRQVGDEFDIVALIDADTQPTTSWLTEMVAPFQDPSVLVATGIRWTEPCGSNWGTMIRSIWNAAAIVQMVCYRIPWGGSLAIRRSFIVDADLPAYWATGFCEDTMLQTLCKKNGGNVAVVPTAIISSDEETTMTACIPWISRQLLTTRLHHPKWPFVMGHGFFTLMLSTALPLASIISLALGYWNIGSQLAIASMVVQIGNLGLVAWINQAVQKKQQQNGETGRSAKQLSTMAFFMGVLITQFVYPYAMIRTLINRTVHWRQVEYRICGKKIEMISYAPFVSTLKEDNSPETLSL